MPDNAPSVIGYFSALRTHYIFDKLPSLRHLGIHPALSYGNYDGSTYYTVAVLPAYREQATLLG